MKVMDQTLQSLWKNHTGPWDVRVSVEFYKWVNTDHPEQGFTQIGDPIDITDYLEWGKLQGIREEVENFKSGKYGMIKASGLAQEFIERLEGIAKTQMGALLPDLLLENNRNASYRYKYDSESVHLWQLVVKIGDASRDKWVSYDWIYGWIYDPTDTDNTTPRWEGTGRTSLGRLRISSFTLLHWLAKTGSEFLGDYQNPAFKYRDWDDEAGVMDFEEDENTLIGNYPLVPIVVEALHHVGVKDEYIHGATKVPYGFPDMPPKITNSYAYSTIDYQEREDVSLTDFFPTPESVFWKAVGTKSLTIWSDGKVDLSTVERRPYFYLTECDKSDGKTQTKKVYLDEINSNIPGTINWAIRRLWIDQDTDYLYALVDYRRAATRSWYVVCKIILAGDYDSIASESTLTMSKYLAGIAPDDDYCHYSQMDMDFSQARMYGAQSKLQVYPLNDYHYIGYWTLTFSVNPPIYFSPNWFCAWTTLYTTPSRGIYHPTRGYIGGFRAVRNPTNTYHGIACYVCNPDGNAIGHIYYDEETDTGNVDDWWEFGEYEVGSPAELWTLYELFGGKGSIGGFYKASTDKFYFQLSSVPRRRAYWAEWVSGNIGTIDIRSCTSEHCGPSGRGYRTFSSHGSNAIEYSTGWEYFYRAEFDSEGNPIEGKEKDYKIALCPAKFCIDPGEWWAVKTTTGSIFANKWEYPLVSAPSVTQDTVFGTADDSIHDRSFVYFKHYVGSGGAQTRAFLVIHSKTWLPNFSKDFISDGGSLKDEFADICVAFGLIGRFSLWGTYIFPRKPEGGITADDSVMILTPNWNGYKEQNIPGVNRVKIEYPGGVTIYPTTNESRNMLNVQSDYILEDRASKFAVDLYALHKGDHTQYMIETSCLAMLEPGIDIVQLKLQIPPGGVGFTDDENKLYEYEEGEIKLLKQGLILGRVMKVDIKGIKTTITVVNL